MAKPKQYRFTFALNVDEKYVYDSIITAKNPIQAKKLFDKRTAVINGGVKLIGTTKY